jgi:two-component system chemotaxis response regulator CheB
VIAQDGASCVVNGMPGAAVAAGVVDAVLSPEDIAIRLVGLVRGGNRHGQSRAGGEEEVES